MTLFPHNLTKRRRAFERTAKPAAAASAALILAFAGMHFGSAKAHAADDLDSDQVLASIGLNLAPSFINMAGKDPKLVGLGSFIVNVQADCNGCHGSDPTNEYLDNNNPYFLKPFDHKAKFNQATYLNGGQNFGPAGPGVVQDPNSPLYGGAGMGPNIITRNLTPDFTGNPVGGVDLTKFIHIIRTGHDFDKLHLNCSDTVTDNCYSSPVDGAKLQVMP